MTSIEQMKENADVIAAMLDGVTLTIFRAFLDVGHQIVCLTIIRGWDATDTSIRMVGNGQPSVNMSNPHGVHAWDIAAFFGLSDVPYGADMWTREIIPLPPQTFNPAPSASAPPTIETGEYEEIHGETIGELVENPV